MHYYVMLHKTWLYPGSPLQKVQEHLSLKHHPRFQPTRPHLCFHVAQGHLETNIRNRLHEWSLPYRAEHCYIKPTATLYHYFTCRTKHNYAQAARIGMYGGACHSSTRYASSLSDHTAVSRQHSQEHQETNSIMRSMNNSYHPQWNTTM